MHLNNRTIQLTQCCTQLKSPGVKILCVLYLNYNVAFSFKWYGNSWNKPFYSQRVWIAYNIEALIFFRLLLSNCLNWKIYCDDHSSLSSTNAVQKWIISYILHRLGIVTLVLRGSPQLLGSYGYSSEENACEAGSAEIVILIKRCAQCLSFSAPFQVNVACFTA